ncbi:LOW QUALITY PROTEIN: stathmin domain-containing protein 1 [Passerculus sandwichensis]
MFTSFDDTPLTNEFISKSSPLEETERQKSILEELRMQGIIKSHSTTARTVEAYENKRDALGKTQKKPPARMEKKLEMRNKRFTVHGHQNKLTKFSDYWSNLLITFGVERQKELLHVFDKYLLPSFETAHQTTKKQTEKDCLSLESQGGTDPQPSPLDAEENNCSRQNKQLYRGGHCH